MNKQISEGRKTAFYLGTGISLLGLLLFLSTFVTFILNFGDFSNFHSDAKSSAARAFGGMVLLMAGGAIRGMGARGLAGSGVVLDPARAREDLEPYSRMAGGMVKDALDEADLHPGPRAPEKVVMLKCRECGRLNEEDSKFCQECGRPL
jgi:hypothetical protein